ncbi:MAG: hypothetical protein A2043_08760 [Candidatus Schekmanbacteria bacterium GWA2_38_9]|nr:MAG: hypothetical protein A2043_08760 [Candidatus Schekmanbacteria bacterium GWA2_38_9]
MKLNLKYLKGFIGYKLFDGKALPPSSISFNLTSKCNLKCEMCWQYRDGGIFKKESPLLLEGEMEFQDLKKVVDDISGSLKNITLWGGEPMLHPDFAQFTGYIKEKEKYLNIITNGSLLKRFAKSLVEMKVNNIVVSIDGPQEIHDEIRGVKGSYQRTIEGIETIKDFKYNYSENLPRIEINFTISDLNFDRVADTVKILQGLNINSITISHLWFADKNMYEKNEKIFKDELKTSSPYFHAFIRETSGVNLKILTSEIAKVKETRWKIPIIFLPDLDNKEIFQYYSNPGNSFRFIYCLVPWRTACVLPNGDLTPCGDRPDFIVGNLRKERFSQLWNNEKFRSYRRALKGHKLFPMCKRCCELFLQ